MKAFFISLILLVLMIGVVIANYFYINHIAQVLEEKLDEIPSVNDEESVQKVADIAEYWEKQMDIVGFSVSFPIVDRVSEQIATLEACANCQDLYGYQTALALLRDAIGDMRRLEAFSAGNLL